MSEILSLSLARLAEELGAQLIGDPQTEILGLATLQDAGPGQLAFLANAQYRKYLADTRASAVLLTERDAEGFAGNALVVADPYLTYARLSHRFDLPVFTRLRWWQLTRRLIPVPALAPVWLSRPTPLSVPALP